MGIDDGGDSVGRIVKAVYEFKTEGDQERDGQQNIGPHVAETDAAYIIDNVKTDEAKSTDECKKDNSARDPRRKFVAGGTRNGFSKRGCEVSFTIRVESVDGSIISAGSAINHQVQRKAGTVHRLLSYTRVGGGRGTMTFRMK